MNRSIFHIVFSLFLTIAVADYLWVDFFEEEEIVAEFETDGEKDYEEELQDSKIQESKTDSVKGFGPRSSINFQLPTIHSGFFKHSNSFDQYTKNLDPPIYIKYRQLKIHC